MKRKLTNFEKDFENKMRNKSFRNAYEKERQKLIIAYKIVQLRAQHKYTQKQLAKKLNTTQSAIARMENGNQNFTIDILDKIASVFGKELKVRFI